MPKEQEITVPREPTLGRKIAICEALGIKSDGEGLVIAARAYRAAITDFYNKRREEYHA